VDLNLSQTAVRDLQVLSSLPLTQLDLFHVPFPNLEALRGLQLRSLRMHGTSKVEDLTPLVGMPLEELVIAWATRLSDLSPLAELPLRRLELHACPRVVNVSPLALLPLTALRLTGTAVRDVRPLAALPLQSIHFEPETIERGLAQLWSSSSLKNVTDGSGKTHPLASYRDPAAQELRSAESQLWRHLRKKRREQARSILSKHPGLMTATNTSSGDWTVLGLLLPSKDPGLIRWALELGAPIDQRSAGNGDTIMHEAAYLDPGPELVDLLIQAGAPIDEANTILGQSPVHYAVIYGRYRMLDFLITQGADLTCTDAKGMTPLDHAQRLKREAFALRIEQALAIGIP
jgi:hypothetical protein